MLQPWRALLSSFALLCAVALSVLAEEPRVDFEKDVLPVLSAHCFKCHGPDKPKSGLRLDDRTSALKGGDSSDHVIVPKQSDKSDLIRRVTTDHADEKMPPKGEPLTKEQVALLRRWIDEGAVWPNPANPLTPTSDDAFITAEHRAYWAFQPIRKPPEPAVKRQGWSRNAIDRFVLAKLEKNDLLPAREATKLELVRRVAFDLTGLPPTLDEIDAFLTDAPADSYERMVERYLASPRYGERQAQHWLDVVRYAETEGFEYDRTVPGLWRYRDYVIDSFNADKPYDRFIAEQVAGDELAGSDLPPEVRNNLLVAAGFHRLGAVRRNAGNQDVTSSRNEVLTERTDIVGSAFLGLTVGCARCHDHKFDPIRQKDYYQLQAYVAGTEEHNLSLAPEEEQKAWKARADAITSEVAKLKRQLKTLEGEAKEALGSRIEALEDSMPAPLPSIATVKTLESPTAIHVLRRGEWEKKGDPVGMRMPMVLASEKTPELPVTTPDARTHLAQWLTSADHPLTARVMANRLWQQHFGQGIVPTPNDFGYNGVRPTHPELLDHLARSFIDSGWSIKTLHRQILLSSTYRQSTTTNNTPQTTNIDPDNRLLSHFSRRRLTAEETRDAMLAASGRLNPKMHGESVIIPADKELVNQLYKPSQWAVTRDGAEHDRRSVYLLAKRNLRLPFMEVFDQPTALNSCARRESSTHAPQALELLNGKTSNDLARSLADRLKREAGDDPARQVDLAFRLATGRAPTEREISRSLEFLKTQPLEEFALSMFNLNAFLHVN